MKTFLLKISSPDGSLFNGDAVMISLRGIEGDLAVLADHVPFITSVKPCDVKILLPDGDEKICHSDGGLLTVATEAVTLLGAFSW